MSLDANLNPEVRLTLRESVNEVLGFLTGLDLTYDPSYDRFRVITRALNRALRSNALEKEWSYYSDVLTLPAVPGLKKYLLTDDASKRVRIINDDAVRIVEPESGDIAVWAYFLPRDSLHKYQNRPGWYCSVTRNTLYFSKVLTGAMDGYDIEVPVMREPLMFLLPEALEDELDDNEEFDEETLDQYIDFPYADVICMRAAFYVAQSDPVMQPRAQTIEAQYKDLMYQVIERDDRNTDTPFQNDFIVPVQNGIYPETSVRPWPLSDRRR
jgi:hypothetical protein